MNSKGIPNYTTKKRINISINYLEKYKPKKILLMGGKYRKDCKLTLSESMYGYMSKKCKLSRNNFFLDRKSLDTVGDAIFSKLYMSKHNSNNKFNIYVFTSKYHVFRTNYIFNKIFKKKVNIFSVDEKISVAHKDKELASLDIFKKNFKLFIKDNKNRSLIYFLKKYHSLYGKI